ncbi:MAG: hypothetical protein IPM50_03390 [Acidobacteriota bacterium]|nr:MAG: hypothetical protein IPM50_03390 [Acidobacteriota bacterium]
MKRSIVVFAVFLLAAGIASAYVSDNIAGKWNILAQADGQTIGITATINADGDNFTGSTASDIGTGQILNGKVTGDKFTATLKTEVMGAIYEFAMEGTITKDGMSGTFTNSNFGSVPFTATKAKD